MIEKNIEGEAETPFKHQPASVFHSVKQILYESDEI